MAIPVPSGGFATILTKSFKKQVTKLSEKHPGLDQATRDSIRLVTQNPSDPRLHKHSFHGKGNYYYQVDFVGKEFGRKFKYRILIAFDPIDENPEESEPQSIYFLNVIDPH